MKKRARIVSRIELKDIRMPTDHGCAVMTFDVYVAAELGTLQGLYDTARDALLRRATRDISRRQKEEMRRWESRTRR